MFSEAIEAVISDLGWLHSRLCFNYTHCNRVLLNSELMIRKLSLLLSDSMAQLLRNSFPISPCSIRQAADNPQVPDSIIIATLISCEAYFIVFLRKSLIPSCVCALGSFRDSARHNILQVLFNLSVINVLLL